MAALLAKQQVRLQKRASVISALVETARPLILECWKQDSCIASTKVAIAVLREFGIKSEPLTVRAYIFNAPLWARLQRGERPEKGEINRLYQIDGSWSVGLGFPSETGTGWPGHLVTVTQRPAVLIDLSLDQASRPERGIALASLALATTPGFLQGKEELPAQVGDTTITYEAHPAVRSYEVSPDWHLDREKRVVPEIVRQIRGQLIGQFIRER